MVQCGTPKGAYCSRACMTNGCTRTNADCSALIDRRPERFYAITLPYTGRSVTTGTPATMGQLIDCAACEGTGRSDGTYYPKGDVCKGCNGAGKQRV